MSSKIRVDPKTFKIINQKQEKESLPSDSETMTSLTSDSSSGSDSESVRVIKLDGGNSQQQPSQQQQPQQSQQSQQSRPPQQQEPQQSKPLQQQQPQQSKPLQQQQQQQQQQPQTQTNINIEKYLKNENSESLSNEELDSESNEELDNESKEESSEKPIVNNNTQAVEEPDVIDLSQSKLYDILHSIFTDSNGISVSENIEKMSKLFDKHNQIMEKILNQLIIMNSNHKQITIPEAVQTNTKIANNDFRNPPEKKENKN